MQLGPGCPSDPPYLHAVYESKRVSVITWATLETLETLTSIGPFI